MYDIIPEGSLIGYATANKEIAGPAKAREAFIGLRGPIFEYNMEK